MIYDVTDEIFDVVRDIGLGVGVVMAAFLVGVFVIGLVVNYPWVLGTIVALFILWLVGYITRAMIELVRTMFHPQ